MKEQMNRQDMANSIIHDILQGIWYEDPCEKCRARTDGSCCGCPDERAYRDKIKPYVDSLGEDTFFEVCAVGRLTVQVNDIQRKLKTHYKRLDMLLSPKHQEMLKRKAEVTAYFKNLSTAEE